jgi:hypothetical protein
MKARSLRAQIFVAALILAGGYVAWSALLFPWSIWLPGRSTLVGTWYGDVPQPSGPPLGVQIDLGGQTGRCTAPCSRIRASALVCGKAGTHAYRGYGNPDNWSGSTIHFSLMPDPPAPAEARPMKLDGTWDRAQLRVLVDFGPPQRPEVTVSERASGSQETAHVHATSVTLIRGEARDFEIACRRTLTN